MARKRLGKKGSILDIVLIIGLALMFGLVALIGFKLVGEFQTKLSASAGSTPEADVAIDKIEGYYTGVIDYSILFLVIGLAVSAFALASLTRIHPIFIPFYFIILIVLIIIAGAASNIYQEMAATTELSGYANQLTVITSILTYLPFLVGILGTILMVVMYKLWDNTRI